MVDSRQKGARAEAAVKAKLISMTGLNWQRTPGSGALDARHGLKGDLYIPQEENLWTIEVKHYKDSHLNSTLITGKNPQIVDWWKQTIRQAGQNGNKPLLVFKHDRSKLFVAFQTPPPDGFRYIYYEGDTPDYCFYIALLEDWHEHSNIEFILR